MNSFFKIALITIFISAYISLSSFIFNIDLDGFKAIHIISTWQIPQQSGQHITYTRSPDLIYSTNYEILREPYPITNDFVKIDSSGLEVPDEKHPSTLKIGYSFFICKKGQFYGVCYSSISDPIGKKYAVDSLIKDFLRFPAFFYTGRGKGKDSIKVIRDKKNGYLTEIITNKKLSENDPDSSYFYYRKKPLDYSFLVKDKRSDNMYLYKAIITYNHIPNADNVNNVVDVNTKFRQSFEISETKVPDINEVKMLIEKFKRSTVNH